MSGKRRDVGTAPESSPARRSTVRRGISSPPISLDALAEYGVYLFALSWPLGAWQRLAGPVHLHHVALVPLIICALRDWMNNKRLRTPFELWWPCVLTAMLIVFFRLGGYETISWMLIAPALMAIVVMHGTDNRGVVLWAIYLSMMSGVMMLSLSVFSRLGLLFPTAWQETSGLVVAGPHGVTEGVFASITLILLLPALNQARRAGEFSPGRPARFIMLALPVLFAIWMLLSPRPELWLWRPDHRLFLYPTVCLAVVVLWGWARLAAKHIVMRSHASAGVAHGRLAVALIGVVVTALALFPYPEAGPILLLAMTASYARPGAAASPVARPGHCLVAPVALLLALNLLFIRSGDPRDYDYMARRALARKEYGVLREALEFIKTLAPEETRADYYIARAWLAENNLPEAAAAFRRAMRPSRPRLLSSPDTNAVDAFLAGMRDASSAMPERMRGLAYEQCLIAAGRERHALSLLELRGETGLWPDLAVGPLAQGLATLLGAPHLVPVFHSWDAELLLAILESAGPVNRTVSASKAFPATQLPMVVMAGVEHDSFHVNVHSPAGSFGGALLLGGPRLRPHDVGALFGDTGWGSWRQNAAGEWLLSYGQSAIVRVGNGPQVFFRDTIPAPEELPYHGVEVVITVPEAIGTHE